MLRNWLKSLLEVSRTLGLSLSDLFGLLSRILQVGYPPPLDDEAALRSWIRTVGQIAVDAAKLTDISADDQLAAFCLTCVDNDDVWETAYSLIRLVAAGTPPQSGDLEAMTMAMPEQSGLSPAVVLALVKLIVEFIQAFRK